MGENRRSGRISAAAMGVVLLMVLAALLLWVQNMRTIQAAMSVSLGIRFDGEYRIGDGQWQPVVEGEHISSTKGDVTLRGRFFLLDPFNGETIGPAGKGVNIAMYFDHIRCKIQEPGCEGHTYNSRITAILYAGLDSQGELETYNRYTIAPRADSIELVILDQYHKKISILAISRDTIASIGRYTMNGNFRGYYDAQLGYAYTYGDGGKVSCTNLVQLYPELSSGSTVQLDAHNVEDFVRWQDTAIPFSNNGRMERQQAFSCGFFRMFREQAIRQPEEMWSKIQSREACMQTSITKSQYLNLVSFLQEETFSDADYYFLKGEDVQGAEFEELHPDPRQKIQTIAQLFYLEDEEGAA